MIAPTNGNPFDPEEPEPTPPPKITHPKKRKMLAALRKKPGMLAAYRAAGIHHSTHAYWLKTDPVYAEAAIAAREEYIESLEEEADSRAKGIEEDVFDKDGNKVGTRIKCSDVLLIFRLKALRPEVYRERYEFKQPQAAIDDAIERQMAILADRGQTSVTSQAAGGDGASG